VKAYNAATAALKPSLPALNVQAVLDYIYLGQFDLLRESRHRLIHTPWAQPAQREAMTTYYKLQRSHEEIIRVNVELHRLVSWIRDEEMQYHKTLLTLQETNPPLAFAMKRKYTWLLAINKEHCRRISKLHTLEGFTGVKGPGVRKGLGKTTDVDHGVCAEDMVDDIAPVLHPRSYPWF
jgi:hypothetical protein